MSVFARTVVGVDGTDWGSNAVLRAVTAGGLCISAFIACSEAIRFPPRRDGPTSSSSGRACSRVGAAAPRQLQAATSWLRRVQLTVARHIDSATFPGYARIFGWQWPSTFYAIDIVARDVFSGWLFYSSYPRSRTGQMQRSFSADRYA